MTIRGGLNVRRDDLNAGQSNGWMLAVPFSSKLVSMARPEHFVFGKLTAYELRPYRETVGRKSTRHAQSRHAVEVEGFRKNVSYYKAIPLIGIDLERVCRCLACRI